MCSNYSQFGSCGDEARLVPRSARIFNSAFLSIRLVYFPFHGHPLLPSVINVGIQVFVCQIKIVEAR